MAVGNVGSTPFVSLFYVIVLFECGSKVLVYQVVNILF
jgi:hypothetical protein